MTRRLLITTFALSVLTAPLAAQTTASVPVPAPAPLVPAAPAAIPVGSKVGTSPSGYEDGGRRDPFVSLVAPKRVSTSAEYVGRARTGLAAIAIADVTVRGIVKNGPSMMAILESPDHKSFVARPKDRLLDASIQSIDAAGVVFTEAVDGAGPAQQVRKALRAPAEDVQ